MRPRVLLPQPDSPTRPSVSPCSMVKRDVIDGAEALSGAAPEGVACVKNFREMFCFHQRHVEQRTTPGRGLLSAETRQAAPLSNIKRCEQPLA